MIYYFSLISILIVSKTFADTNYYNEETIYPSNIFHCLEDHTAFKVLEFSITKKTFSCFNENILITYKYFDPKIWLLVKKFRMSKKRTTT